MRPEDGDRPLRVHIVSWLPIVRRGGVGNVHGFCRFVSLEEATRTKGWCFLLPLFPCCCGERIFWKNGGGTPKFKSC